jgi:RNA-directed DNA polymerase
MTTVQLRKYLRISWPEIKEALLAGEHQPQPVRRVEIPKPGGGVRMLGIPTVVDRMIQQAIAQVLSPTLEESFSENSHGFRPGRSAHQAVKAAREHIAQGRHWVVDMNLEKFFDRLNHDVLMSLVARKVHDKGLLGSEQKGHIKGDRSRRCSRISCSMTWTRSLKNAGTAFAGTPTIATFTLHRRHRENV